MPDVSSTVIGSKNQFCHNRSIYAIDTIFSTGLYLHAKDVIQLLCKLPCEAWPVPLSTPTDLKHIVLV